MRRPLDQQGANNKMLRVNALARITPEGWAFIAKCDEMIRSEPVKDVDTRDAVEAFAPRLVVPEADGLGNRE